MVPLSAAKLFLAASWLSHANEFSAEDRRLRAAIVYSADEDGRQLALDLRKTVGVRIPEHVVTQAILTELGEPLLSSTLLLPDQEEPMTQGWEIKERLDHAVDAVIDSGECGVEPTTVIDFSIPVRMSSSAASAAGGSANVAS